ncbi:unnamed protein product [Diatraea saccharalis]|uniref:Nuclear cap-binding protein subunit 3 n=1 Tax=Diatraea saccharalis TaxID=40085 RepID=A0A9N9QUY4_9NEOP|nr:unnamed protein product [Diatraea saccharalis]
MEREEGEMSDEDISMLVDEVNPKQLPMDVAQTQQTIMYKADKHGLLVQQLEKVDASKLEERAKRFGLDLTGNKVVTQKQIDELYANCGIESGNERHFRFDTIHLNGVDNLTTREIFEYLEDFKPVSLEWIDDSSCNIVCQDHITAALALLVHSREIKSDDVKNMLQNKSPHHWREGAPHPKNDLIFMRFATNGDKKMSKKKSDYDKHPKVFDDPTISKNPWGDLCQTWGVYDHQEIFQRKLPDHEYKDEDDDCHEVVQVRNKRLAMRLGKRNHNSFKNHHSDDSNSDSEWKKKSKTPRMRMHADDEESKHKTKSPNPSRESSNDRDVYAPLSIEVVNSKSNYMPRETTKLSDKFKTSRKQIPKSSIQLRLGSKVTRSSDVWSSDESLADSMDHHVMSRVKKINTNTNNTSVWSRLENVNNDINEQNDLRSILKSRKHKKPDDLRERLSKSKQSHLRIEIDNNYARS